MGRPGAPEGGQGGGVALDDVSRLTGLFPCSPGGTLTAPGDDGFFPAMCSDGTI